MIFRFSDMFTYQQDQFLSDKLSMSAYIVQSDPKGFALRDIVQEFNKQKIFATLKVPCDRVHTVISAQEIGFRLVDTSITFAYQLNQGVSAQPKCESVRLASHEDSKDIRRIASSVFSYSRFHLDPRLSNDTADAIKESWAENYFNGSRGQAMFVVCDAHESVVGFCQVLRPSAAIAIIDLIGVLETGKGYGHKLIKAVMADHERWAAPYEIRVGTQVANTQACRFYEGLGFRQHQSSYVFHWMGEDEV